MNMFLLFSCHTEWMYIAPTDVGQCLQRMLGMLPRRSSFFSLSAAYIFVGSFKLGNFCTGLLKSLNPSNCVNMPGPSCDSVWTCSNDCGGQRQPTNIKLFVCPTASFRLNWGTLCSTLFRVESFNFDIIDSLLTARNLLAATNLHKIFFFGSKLVSTFVASKLCQICVALIFAFVLSS